jgi:CHAT domain-containing protein
MTENDCLLEAREIMNLTLRTDPAFSARETANGRIREGEGVVGMSWGFFVAGTRSLLVSKWKKAEALQRAALKLLQDRQYRHPFYWAGFILIGDGR